eukprot:2830631-Pyramimonas_sp.AAC.1
MEPRNLALHCKAAAYRVCLRSEACRRVGHQITSILEDEEGGYVVAYQNQKLYCTSIFKYLNEVWSELTAIPGVPPEPVPQLQGKTYRALERSCSLPSVIEVLNRRLSKWCREYGPSVAELTLIRLNVLAKKIPPHFIATLLKTYLNAWNTTA